jgi:hypothetical protein
MTSPQPAPPLPSPPQPAQAARALAEAALAAAGAWAQPLDSTRHGRAVSQLYSALRDLGIASRGLADWQAADIPPGTESAEFARHVTSGARWLLSAWISLEGVLASEGLGLLPDPDEPGAALCQAARTTIPAWRQPTGTGAERDATIRRLIIATGFLSTATLGLATWASRRAVDLQSVGASLAEVTANLTAALRETGSDTLPGRAVGPAPRQLGSPE